MLKFRSNSGQKFSLEPEPEFRSIYDLEANSWFLALDREDDPTIIYIYVMDLTAKIREQPVVVNE